MKRSYCFIVVLSFCMSHAVPIEEHMDVALSILDVLQKDNVYIPRRFNTLMAEEFRGASLDDLVAFMQAAEESDNAYIMNAAGALLAKRTFDDQNDIEYVHNKLSEKTWLYVAKYIKLFKDRPQTRACGDVDISVADYVNTYGVPLEYLGNVGILRFDSKDLTSLYGIQYMSFVDVAIATFASNCIEGSNLDPQFPSNAFGGLPSLSWLHLEDNSMAALPASFLSTATGLTRINLADNQFTGIISGLFDDLSEVGLVNFSNNLALVTLPSTTFQDMTNLRVALLHDNAIVTISSSLFTNNIYLQVLDLSNNAILIWPASTLDNLTELKHLNLANNLLTAFAPNTLPDGATVILTGNALTPLQQAILIANFPEVKFIF